jgi:patatin-like phospholipase/acyl hydrolase
MAKNYRQLTESINSRLNPDSLILEKAFSDELGTISYNDTLVFIRTAMKGVDANYTQRSRDAGERVKDHLNSLADKTFKYQGSVMTNLDGGVFANNPSMCGYAECRTTEFKQVKCPNASDMLFLSIGTGGGQLHFPKLNKVGVWNVIKWAKSAPDIMMDGSIDTVHYQMKQLFETVKSSDSNSNYKRIDVPLEKRKYDSDMSNASENNIQALKKAGGEALKESLKQKENEMTLDTFIDKLIENQ